MRKDISEREEDLALRDIRYREEEEERSKREYFRRKAIEREKKAERKKKAASRIIKERKVRLPKIEPEIKIIREEIIPPEVKQMQEIRIIREPEINITRDIQKSRRIRKRGREYKAIARSNISSDISDGRPERFARDFFVSRGAVHRVPSSVKGRFKTPLLTEAVEGIDLSEADPSLFMEGYIQAVANKQILARERAKSNGWINFIRNNSDYIRSRMRGVKGSGRENVKREFAETMRSLGRVYRGEQGAL